jgi:hypothetical protein
MLLSGKPDLGPRWPFTVNFRDIQETINEAIAMKGRFRGPGTCWKQAMDIATKKPFPVASTAQFGEFRPSGYGREFNSLPC